VPASRGVNLGGACISVAEGVAVEENEKWCRVNCETVGVSVATIQHFSLENLQFFRTGFNKVWDVATFFITIKVYDDATI